MKRLLKNLLTERPALSDEPPVAASFDDLLVQELKTPTVLEAEPLGESDIAPSGGLSIDTTPEVIVDSTAQENDRLRAELLPRGRASVDEFGQRSVFNETGRLNPQTMFEQPPIAQPADRAPAPIAQSTPQAPQLSAQLPMQQPAQQPVQQPAQFPMQQPAQLQPQQPPQQVMASAPIEQPAPQSQQIAPPAAQHMAEQAVEPASLPPVNQPVAPSLPDLPSDPEVQTSNNRPTAEQQRSESALGRGLLGSALTSSEGDELDEQMRSFHQTSFWDRFDEASAAANLFSVPPAAITVVIGPLEVSIGVARRCSARHWVGECEVFVLTDRANVPGEPTWNILRRPSDVVQVLENGESDFPLIVLDIQRELPAWVRPLVARLRQSGVGLVHYVLDDDPSDEDLATWHGELGRPSVLDLAAYVAPERINTLLDRGEPIASVAGMPISTDLLLALRLGAE
ncbi:MAG: hypothetical protein ACRBK7_24085 [Acidimicrobiales bacterium]